VPPLAHAPTIPRLRERVKEKSCFFVYLLRLANGSLYAGYARDAAARLRRHRQGTAWRAAGG
jgi:hypothetical protein